MSETRRFVAAKNILLLHNRYQQQGGEDTCFESERDLLRERGHSVTEYVVQNPPLAGMGAAVAGFRAVWNREAYRHVRSLIREQRTEVVHVHNFFPLMSPAVHYAAHAEGVPVVQTLHNYRLCCAGALMFREGRPCEDCIGRVMPLDGIRHGCYRDSRAATAAVVGMLAAHRLLRTWSRVVSAFIVLTSFAKDKFITAGLPENKLFVKPNCVPDRGVGDGAGAYALFVGRLTREKGIDVLLDAWEQAHAGIQLKIVGSGPLEEMVRERASRRPDIHYVGYCSAEAVSEMMKGALALIVPSIWYEGLPCIIPEAFCAGTPVLASKLGAMDAVVAHGQTGLKHRPNDPADLALHLRTFADATRWMSMRRAARAMYTQAFSPDRNYEMLRELYSRLVKGGHPRIVRQAEHF